MMEEERPKLPFNDHKHIPSRPEIDTLLGVLPAIELKRFEAGLELIEPLINWSFEWYENAGGWGYRGSYKSRVVCIIHFFRGHFIVTFAVPLDLEEQFLASRDMSDAVRERFAKDFTLSPKAKWITVRVWKHEEVEALLPLMRMKVEDLKKKAGGKR